MEEPFHPLLPQSATKDVSRLVYLEPVTDSVQELQSKGILEFWELIRSRRRILLGITLLALVTAAVVTFLQTPKFQARTTLEVQSPSEVSLNFSERERGQFAAANLDNYTQTQVSILQSRTLRTRVDESFRNQHRSWEAQPTKVTAWARWLGIPVATPQPIRTSGVIPVTIATHVITNTHLIEITCESPNSDLAADYANRLASELQVSEMEVRSNAAKHAGAWLTQETERLRRKLETSEQELQAKSRNTGLVLNTDQVTAEQDKLKQLQEGVSTAEADRIQKEAQFDVASTTPVDAMPTVLKDSQLESYEIRLADLRRELAQLTTDLTPEHYKVKRLNAQITLLESLVEQQKKQVLMRVRNEYNAALRRENLLRSAFLAQRQVVAKQTETNMSYDLLKREVESDRKLYEVLLQRGKQVDLDSAGRTSSISVVDPAVPPMHPYKPNLVRNLLAGLTSGLLLAVLFIFVSDQLNRSLKAPGDTALHLKIPELGVILEDHSNGYKLKDAEHRAPRLSGHDDPDEEYAISAWQKKPPLVAESFRNALASILVAGKNGERPQVILLTSPSRGEGKSTMVSNLGLALAEINQRVLLIDADMRNPNLHQLFGVSNSWGLSDLLRERTTIENLPREALAKVTPMRDLYLLPSGPGTASIATLIYSTRMAALLVRARQEFDIVLIDTPPIAYISDARVLGRLADAVILVVRAGCTSRDQALAAKQRLCADGINVIGAILNGWELKPNGDERYRASAVA